MPSRMPIVAFSSTSSKAIEANFNNIARKLLDEAGPSFAAFPRTDGKGGYDCVHIIPHI